MQRSARINRIAHTPSSQTPIRPIIAATRNVQCSIHLPNADPHPHLLPRGSIKQHPLVTFTQQLKNHHDYAHLNCGTPALAKVSSEPTEVLCLLWVECCSDVDVIHLIRATFTCQTLV
jgi:hypothetical protein